MITLTLPNKHYFSMLQMKKLKPRMMKWFTKTPSFFMQEEFWLLALNKI